MPSLRLHRQLRLPKSKASLKILLPVLFAEVVELVDTPDSKSGALKKRAGSIPAFGTSPAIFLLFFTLMPPLALIACVHTLIYGVTN